MRKAIVKTNRAVRLFLILCAVLLTTACGDEGLMYDEDGFDSQAQALEAVEDRALVYEQREFHTVNKAFDEVDQPSDSHFAERLDFTKFDPVDHRTDIDEEVENHLNLDEIKRFGLDCDGSHQNCGPADSDGRGLDVDSYDDETDFESDEAETDDDGIRDDLEFNPERHRITITTEIGNRLDLDRIKRFGLDCNDASNNCAPHGDRNTDR